MRELVRIYSNNYLQLSSFDFSLRWIIKEGMEEEAEEIPANSSMGEKVWVLEVVPTVITIPAKYCLTQLQP